MAVTIHVNGKSNSLTHKGSMGITKSTLPDVCKTPSPGGPIPIPYPVIVSLSSDLKKGSKKVKVDGGNSAAIKGSEFSRCSGDEPGTAGGVKSSTNMKEATWILYSFDVKIEGKNACRLSDKMMMNHGNTACLAGIQQFPVLVGQDNPECIVACAIICCDKANYKKGMKKDSKDGKGTVTVTARSKACRSLSTTKHSCVLHSLRERPGGKLSTEQKFPGKAEAPTRAPLIPDSIVTFKDGNTKAIDAKFPCDTAATDPTKMLDGACPSDMTKTGKEYMGEKEKKDYLTLADESEAMSPKDAKEYVDDKDNECKSCEPCDFKDA